MSREIKFRALRENHSQFEYGTYANMVTYPDSEMSHTIQPNGWKIDPETLGEFIRLKDKNGVEIYEGDIVRAKHRTKNTYVTGQINMPKSCWVLEIPHKGSGVMRFRTAEFSEFEVIGNIYQNPELCSK